MAVGLGVGVIAGVGTGVGVSNEVGEEVEVVISDNTLVSFLGMFVMTRYKISPVRIKSKRFNIIFLTGLFYHLEIFFEKLDRKLLENDNSVITSYY